VWNNLHITADIIFRPTMTHVVISLRGQLDIQRQALRHDSILTRYFVVDNLSELVSISKSTINSIFKKFLKNKILPKRLPKLYMIE
jgi:hypothetical protein